MIESIPDQGRGRRYSATALAALGFVILVGLGLWQLQRLASKTALIERYQQALAAPPIELGDTLPEGLSETLAFRRIMIRGRFSHDHEMRLVARTRLGRVGVEVVTPLITESGQALLVSRGWVPDEFADPATRAAGQPAGMVAVEGQAMPAQRPNWFTPDNQPDQNVWYWLDSLAMAEIAATQPRNWYVRAGPTANDGGYPLGHAYDLGLGNDHLSYAITWFVLALALAAIFVHWQLRRLRATVG